MADAAQIAASLSVGDRTRLRATYPDGSADRRKFSSEALFRLVQIGLADPIARDLRREITKIRLTPLGEQVRAILQGEAE